MNGAMVLCIVRGVASRLQDHCISTQRLYAGAHGMRHLIWDARDDADPSTMNDIEDDVRQADAVLIVHNNSEMLSDAPDFRLEFDGQQGATALHSPSSNDVGPIVALRPAGLPASSVREILMAVAYKDASDRFSGPAVLGGQWYAESSDERLGSYLFCHTRKTASFFQSQLGQAELSTAVPARSIDELTRRADYMMLSGNHADVMASLESRGIAQGLKATVAAIAQARSLRLADLADDDAGGWQWRYRQLTGRLNAPTVEVVTRLVASAEYAVESVAEPDHITSAMVTASLKRCRVVTAGIANSATTLDALCVEHEIPRLDILRLDAASLAAEVVRDARGILRRSPDCVLVIEIDPQELGGRGKQVRDVIWAMRGLDFYGRQIRDDFALGPFNCLDSTTAGHYLFAKPDRWISVLHTLTGAYEAIRRQNPVDIPLDLDPGEAAA